MIWRFLGPPFVHGGIPKMTNWNMIWWTTWLTCLVIPSTKKGVTAAGLNLKYATVHYRDNLQINTKYECPSMVLEKEWKELMDDAKEKALRKQGKTRPIGSRRYVTYHIFNEKCSIFFLLLNIFKLRYLTYLKPFIGSSTPLKWQKRVEQHGQHKLGQGGYQKLRERIIRIKQSLFVANN